jgi:hypothetical protein
MPPLALPVLQRIAMVLMLAWLCATAWACLPGRAATSFAGYSPE